MASRVLIKPLLKVSDKQWRSLLQRIILRQPAKGMIETQLPQEALGAATDVMGSAPLEKRVYGRLYEQSGIEGVPKKPLDLPWESASMAYRANPERFAPAEEAVPMADVLRVKRSPTKVSGVAQEAYDRGFAKDLADLEPWMDIPERTKKPVTYERRVFRPVKEGTDRAVAAAEEEAKQQEKQVRIESKLRKKQEGQVGVATGAMESPTQTLGKTVDRDRLFKEALLLDTVWKDFIGGGRTLTGRAWGGYLGDEAKRYRGQLKSGMTPRDYFQMVALKWLHEPEKTLKRYPREVRSIEKIFQEVEKEHGPIFAKE